MGLQGWLLLKVAEVLKVGVKQQACGEALWSFNKFVMKDTSVNDCARSTIRLILDHNLRLFWWQQVRRYEAEPDAGSQP